MPDPLTVVSTAIGILPIATRVIREILRTISGITDSPRSLQRLEHELRDLDSILTKIGQAEFTDSRVIDSEDLRCGTALHSCLDQLSRLRQLVGSLQLERNSGRIWKGFRTFLKGDKINNAVNALQSRKLNLCLALLTNLSNKTIPLHVAAGLGYQWGPAIPVRLDSSLLDDSGLNQPPLVPDSHLSDFLADNIERTAAAILEQGSIEDPNLLNLAQTQELRKVNAKFVSELKSALEQQRRERVMASLYTPDYQQDRVCIEDPVTSTCEWIWTHPNYLSWIESTRPSVLHVIGKPGSGKTVLSKHMLGRLSNTAIKQHGVGGDSELLFYFCDSRKRPEESASTILRGLIHQFLSKRPSLIDSLIVKGDIMDSHPFSSTSLSWSLEALWKIFSTAMSESQLQAVYCIVDALDECDYASAEELLELLSKIIDPGTRDMPQVKILVTSRPYDHITDGFSRPLRIQISSEIVKSDINVIVGKGMERLRKRLQINKQIQTELRETLVERADGMFLWAILAMKQIEKARFLTSEKLQELVQELPSGLDALYDQILTRICNDALGEGDTRMIQKIFTWVVLAARPLSLLEFRTALAVEPGDESLTSAEPRFILNIARTIRNLCGPFLEIVSKDRDVIKHQLPVTESSTKLDSEKMSGGEQEEEEEDLTAVVRLIHQSVKEYLLDVRGKLQHNQLFSKFRVNLHRGHKEIAWTCLTYLRFREFGNGRLELAKTSESEIPNQHKSLQELLEHFLVKNELLEYATLHWPSHVRGCENGTCPAEDDITTFTCDFLTGFPAHIECWYQVRQFLLFPGRTDFNYDVSSIHVASLMSLHTIFVRLLDDKDLDVNKMDGWGGTPLITAADSQTVSQDTVKIVEHLLQRNADINIQDKFGFSALMCASSRGKRDIVRLFLDRNADIEAKDDEGRTALHYAASNGHTDVANLLLNDLAKTNSNSSTPLHMASRNGHPDVVRFLLERNAEIGAKDIYGRAPIHLASQGSHLKVLEILLERGAKIEARDDEGATALHLASMLGEVEATKLLLSKGANVEARADNGLTPMHCASRHNHPEIVQLIIDNCGDPTAKDCRESSPLHAAAIGGNAQVVEILLKHCDSRKSCDKNGWTASLVASRSLHSTISQRLQPDGDNLGPRSQIGTKFPTCWSQVDKGEGLRLTEHDRTVEFFDGAPRIPGQSFSVRADYCIPAERDTFYFEAEIISCGQTSEIGIGFSESYTPLVFAPGWSENTWGYHGDDGMKYNGQDTGEPYAEPFTSGDIIGCGVDFKKSTAYFTKNGVFLGDAFTGVFGQLYPQVGFASPGARIKVNFGDRPFMYKE